MQHAIDRVGCATGHVQRKPERIHAYVEQRAAAQRRVVQPAGRVIAGVKTERGIYRKRRAYAALSYPVLCAPVRGHRTRPKRFHQQRIAFPRGFDCGQCVALAAAHRLFAQHRLVMAQCGKRLRQVQVVGHAYVHGVDIRVFQHIIDVAIAAPRADLSGECIGALLSAAQHGADLAAGYACYRLCKAVGDGARTCDCKSHIAYLRSI